jgi:integrase
MKNNKTFKQPTFKFSRKAYQCYIYYGAFDHIKGSMFVGKIRDIGTYCQFHGFEQLREHCQGSKKAMTEYVDNNILPKVAEDIVSGQYDKGINEKNWKAVLQRRRSAEFIPITNLIDEYVQMRYQTNESISNQDLYFNALDAFKHSLQHKYGKAGLKELTIKDMTEGICNEVFANWAKYRKDWSDNTRKTYRSKIHAFFNAYSQLLPVNPVTKASRVKSNDKNKNMPLANQDYKKIMHHLKQKTKRKYKELFGFAMLMYYGLLRGDTILKLKCINVKKNAKNYNIEVYSSIVKNGQSGTISIPNHVIEYLISTNNYNPMQPEKLLFPPTFRPRPNRSSKAFRQRKGEHLRNRMWASNLWNDILRNELGYSKEFTTLHNFYCLKATGALYLYKVERWDIQEISAQCLHTELTTTFKYIAKLDKFDADPEKRVFRQVNFDEFEEKNEENLAKTENSPKNIYSERMLKLTVTNALA